MTKSLANKLYLKKKLYTFYMPASRKISEHIDEFNKIILDLANIEVNFKDEDLALLLLPSLPASYEHFVDTLLYGRKELTLEDGDNRECKIRECDRGSVLLGDNRECKIRGIGKVRVQLRDGLSFMLNNVRYIPELKRNLISLGTLEKEGYTVKLQSGKVTVINGSKIALSGIRRDNYVYSLDGHAVAGEINASVEEKDSLAQVWHKRLGHINEAGLQVLEKHGLFGKKSLEWKQLVENHTGRTVRKIRTDNGLEFCNREFKQLCVESGIARHLTAVGTPQQNGLAERMNRTLMDKVRCLLIQSGLPKTFYAEATCKLEPRAIKCVPLGYPEGVKGYRLYRLDDESPKIVTSRNMVLNERVMYKDTLKDSGVGVDKSVEELQVEVELHRLNNHTPEEDQEDGDDEDAGDQETDQTLDLTDYQLARDRERMTRTKPLRFRDESNMAAYAFIAAEEEDTHKPLTYQEAVSCEDSSKWKASIKEEMDSLRKNKTWELVDQPVGLLVMSCKWLFKIKEGLKVFKSLGTRLRWKSDSDFSIGYSDSDVRIRFIVS
ncbi:retrovirus-related pol polyprotein from transposon TNT 1-94 [Tanacetum coccineum]